MKKMGLILILLCGLIIFGGCTQGSSAPQNNITTAAGMSAVQTQVQKESSAAATDSSITVAKTVSTAIKTQQIKTTGKVSTTVGTFKKVAAPLAVDKKKIGDTMVSPISKKTYSLKFIDEFSGTKLNASNWKFVEKNANGSESQKNLESNIAMSNGILNLKGAFSTTEYTLASGKKTKITGTMINSSGIKGFKYGRIEARVLLPKGKGLWPAWWTCGTEDGWPWGGEIDIFEFNGGTTSTTNGLYSYGMHWCDPDTSANNAYNNGPGKKVSVAAYILPGANEGNTLSKEWHVYGVEWTKTAMTFYFDGEVNQSFQITDKSTSVAFHQAHYLILNFATGGTQAGEPTAESLPNKMQVDWVKVWQTEQ